MASNNSNKLTYFNDSGTVLTGSFMNTFYYTQNGLTALGIPAYGHKHDGQRLDGHAQKINLTTDVEGALSLDNIDGSIYSTIELDSTGSGSVSGDTVFNADDASGIIRFVAGNNTTFVGSTDDYSITFSSKDTEYAMSVNLPESNIANLVLQNSISLDDQIVKFVGLNDLSVSVDSNEIRLDVQIPSPPTLDDLLSFTTKGDLLSFDGSSSYVLPAGADGKFLKTNSSQTSGLEWVSITQNEGDVVGPSSATPNAIARYSGDTGKIIKDSAVTIDDSGNVVVTIGYLRLDIGDIRSLNDITANIFNQNSNINIGNSSTSEQLVNIATSAKAGIAKSTVNIGSQSDSSMINLRSYTRYESKLFCGEIRTFASSVTQTLNEASLNYRYYRYSPLDQATTFTFELGDPALELGRVITIANNGVGHLDIHYAGGIETHVNGVSSHQTLHIESGEWAEIVSIHNNSNVIMWAVLIGGTVPNFAN